MSFRAFQLTKSGDLAEGAVATLDEHDLMPGAVTIRVAWSDLNYKDALACAPRSTVVRNYPMVPGIDLTGTVVSSDAPGFQPGQQVVVIGHELGASHFGGFAELARVPAEWVVPLPAGLSPREAALIGTAGFTAAMSVEALEKAGVTPDRGPVLVTGATGGVGSMAVTLLAQRGYTVAASTGKASEQAYLRSLGASEILDRDEVSVESNRPLERARWAGAVDPVGGPTTAYLVRTTGFGGAVALSGNAGGVAVNTTVLPFILRGVSLVGIDSANYPIGERRRLWGRLATDLKPGTLDRLVEAEIGLDGLPDACARILAGNVRGRVLVEPGR